MAITITALPAPLFWGDWHDKPLRWAVTGPGAERQLFSTKRDAAKYASLRRKNTQEEATARFVFSGLELQRPEVAYKRAVNVLKRSAYKRRQHPLLGDQDNVDPVTGGKLVGLDLVSGGM